MPELDHEAVRQTASALVGRSPTASLLLDDSLACVETNDHYLRLSGQGRAEAAGTGWHMAIDSNGRDEFLRALGEAMADDRGLRGRLRLLSAQGSFCWTDIALTPLGGAGAVLTLRDITLDRADARRAGELSRLLENSPDFVVVLDPTGRFIRWANTTAADSLPSDPKGIVDHLDEWSQATYLTTAISEVHRGRRWHGELTIVGRGGDQPLSVMLATHADEQGVVEAISFVGRDLGELRQAERRVQAGEARLAAMVEHAADLVCVTDAEGLLVYASPAVNRALGVDASRLDGISVYDLLHVDDVEPAQQAVADALSEAGRTVSTELRVSADGKLWRHLDVVITNLLDNPAVGGLVLNARDVTDRVEAALALTQRAEHDDLTGLPNRAKLNRELTDRLARARAAGTLVGVLFLDLDRFKVVNDSLGHAAGDELLRVMAVRLREAVRPFDLVARIGGDEFVVVLDDMTDRTDAIVAAQRLRRAVSQPVSLAGGSTSVSTSVGIAIAEHDDTTPEELLRDSDTALYRAKERGRDRAEVFRDKLREQAVNRLHTEQLLRQALDDNGLGVHYQPIIDLTDGAVVGAEALVRVHDGADFVPAAHLIEVAEDSGLITRLGQRVLHDAIRDTARLVGSGGRPLQVSVNVSARQLGAPRFATTVRRALADAEVDGTRLTLEITETTLLEAHPSAERTLHRLADDGVRLALDDFGTGFSSLSYLRRLPIHVVKVDRTFVSGLGRNPDDDAIVSATVALAHQLGLTVVAEGIETPDQRRRLQELGAEQGQGHLFGRPTPLATLVESSALVELD